MQASLGAGKGKLTGVGVLGYRAGEDERRIEWMISIRDKEFGSQVTSYEISVTS